MHRKEPLYGNGRCLIGCRTFIERPGGRAGSAAGANLAGAVIEMRTVRIHKGGFTLIEVLIVTVIIAVLAAIAIPQISFTRDRAIVSSMQSDLRNLMVNQEMYHGEHETYAADLDQVMPVLRRSSPVEITIDSATATGWGAHAVHPAVSVRCGVAVSLLGHESPKCVMGEGDG